MEKYIINNNTIALLKINHKTIIINVDNLMVFNKCIISILEENCIYYGSTLKGRISSAKKILNEDYKIPILIDDINNLLLIQINSPRNKICLFLVSNKIVNYVEKDNFLEIKCLNNVTFKVKITKNSFEKMLLKSFKINNVLFWRKNAKFL